MRARQFRKRIEVWETSATKDVYGGASVTETQLGTSWCDIKTLSRDIDVTQFGVSNTDLLVEITLRKRSDITYNSINQFLKFNGDKYTILSFPTDKDFNGSFIRIVAMKEQTKSV